MSWRSNPRSKRHRRRRQSDGADRSTADSSGTRVLKEIFRGLRNLEFHQPRPCVEWLAARRRKLRHISTERWNTFGEAIPDLGDENLCGRRRPGVELKNVVEVAVVNPCHHAVFNQRVEVLEVGEVDIVDLETDVGGDTITLVLDPVGVLEGENLAD